MIPDFDPLNDNVTSWLKVIASYASTFSWTVSVIRYQALNKLKGSAKIRYESLLRNDHMWTAWLWKDWKKRLKYFQSKTQHVRVTKRNSRSKTCGKLILVRFFLRTKI